ncbi:alpha/beta-hydrolase [Ceraceosorus guamensis]|uniref:Alpha/beta-hydrolase n=1 Tax=Ceraceosorus guamensis TaxID=1522189 RepID=A0A316W407_9BASI|nr:alpha/beta-hydrolase [Ceraceosorus guamensis]PWN42345.1 alpha/beta-hydrolase [Ceraceosorus guamensis]
MGIWSRIASLFQRRSLELAPLTLAYAGPDSRELQQVDLFPAERVRSARASSSRSVDGAAGEEGAPPPPPPLLIFIHGGAWRSGDKSDHYSMARHLSKRGVSVALVNYRLSTATGGQVLHPAHAHDAFRAVEFLLVEDPKHPPEEWRKTFDASRTVLVGHSVGAHMVAAMSLNAASKSTTSEADAVAPMPSLGRQARGRIRAWVGVSGIYSIISMLRAYPEYISFVEQAFGNGAQKGDAAERYLPASLESWTLAMPGTYAAPAHNAPKVHLLHSREDELLSVGQTTEAAEHLQRLLETQGGSVTVDLDSYKGTHDGSLQTEAYFETLLSILKQEHIL